MKKKEKRERKKQDRGIVDFMMVANHFFHFLREWIFEMEDPRNQSYTTYIQADLGYMAILKNVCGQHSMREMEENFNKETCIDTLRIMSGNSHLEEMPHYDNDTLNYYLERLSPECLSVLRKKIKKDYPRLPICIQGDALYATEPFMELCSKTYHWKYLFTQKDTRQKKLDEGFEWIKSGDDAVRQTGLCKENGTGFLRIM